MFNKLRDGVASIAGVVHIAVNSHIRVARRTEAMVIPSIITARSFFILIFAIPGLQLDAVRVVIAPGIIITNFCCLKPSL